MRIIYFLFFIVIFTSCDHPKKPYFEELTWPKRTLKLDNDLGVLTIRLPREFDTFYRYEYSSDISSSDSQIICFKNSKFKDLLESQWSTPKLDSLYHFSIHFASEKGNSQIVLIDSSYLQSWIGRYKADDKFAGQEIIFKSVEKINGLDLIAFGVESDSDNLKNPEKFKVSPTLIALTLVKGEYLHFQFQCAAHNCDSFIPKMYKALKTVEINPN